MIKREAILNRSVYKSLVTRTTATTLPRHELRKSRLKVFIFNHKFECLRKTVANALLNQNCHKNMEFMFFNIWFWLFCQNKTRWGKKGFFNFSLHYFTGVMTLINCNFATSLKWRCASSEMTPHFLYSADIPIK